MWTGEFIYRDAAKLEAALKSEHGGHKVLVGEIGAKGDDAEFARAFPKNIPVILVLSQGATEAYAANNNIFSKYGASREPVLDGYGYRYFSITETQTDCLAWLRVNGKDSVEVQGDSFDKWFPIDFNRQSLGLAIITAKEGKNSMARFWAKAFPFNKE